MALRPRRHRWTGAAFISPSFLFLAALLVYPLSFALYFSVHRWNLSLSPHPQGYVGTANFAEVFTDPNFGPVLRTTLLFSLLAVALEVLLALGIALVLNARLWGVQIVRTVLIVPTTVAPIVAGFLFRFLFYNDSLVPYLLRSVGIAVPAEGILGNSGTAFWGVIATDVWQWTPFVALILLAALQTVPLEISEAAQIDGAGAWQNLRYVVLPIIRTTAAAVALIRFMQAFNVFDIIYAETQGGPGIATRTLAYGLYYQGLVYFNIGHAAALTWVITLIAAVIINLYLQLAMRDR